MDSKGRLHYTQENGEEFIGKSFDETGVSQEFSPNRHERRAQAAIDRQINKLRNEMARICTPQNT